VISRNRAEVTVATKGNPFVVVNDRLVAEKVASDLLCKVLAYVTREPYRAVVVGTPIRQSAQ
jgi:hypothetical protein